MRPPMHPCRVFITACSHNISQRLHLYSQYSPPQSTNAGFPSNRDSGKELHPDHISALSFSLTTPDACSPITNARAGRSPKFAMGGISAQPSSTYPIPILQSTSNVFHPAMCLRLHVLTAMAGKACLEIPSPPSFRPVPAKTTKSALLSPTPSRFLSARMSSMGKRPLILSSMVMMTLRTRRAQAGSAQASKRTLVSLGER
jgi:hypothetical protein